MAREKVIERFDPRLRAERLRRDVLIYAARLEGREEVAPTERPFASDLDDDDVDYQALYGKRV